MFGGKKKKTNYFVYILIILAGCCFCCSISSSIGGYEYESNKSNKPTPLPDSIDKTQPVSLPVTTAVTTAVTPAVTPGITVGVNQPGIHGWDPSIDGVGPELPPGKNHL